MGHDPAPPLEPLAAAFARALLDPAAPPPAGLKAWHCGETTRRFAVYRNNVIVSLIDALEQRFPVCARLVGEEFFRAMARLFVRRRPPRSPILADYGEDFPLFVEAFEPARDLAYLPDVARLEYAIGRAYHAADAAPMAIEAIKSVPSECLDRVAISLHPSVQLVASRHPIVSIWRTNRNDANPSGVDLTRAEDALVIRPRLDVEALVLPDGGLAFMRALASGGTLGAAAAAGQAAAEEFDLAACFEILLSRGAIVAMAPNST
jgi:hypothetical protein